MARGISIRGLGGNYTASKLKRKIKSLKAQLERAESYMKLMEKQKAM